MAIMMAESQKLTLNPRYEIRICSSKHLEGAFRKKMSQSDSKNKFCNSNESFELSHSP